MWRSLVSRLVRVQEASGSNPDTPTKKLVITFVIASFLCLMAKEPEASCISIFGRKQMCVAQSASGSNPDTPTKNEDCPFGRSSFFIWFVSGFERPARTK